MEVSMSYLNNYGGCVSDVYRDIDGGVEYPYGCGSVAVYNCHKHFKDSFVSNEEMINRVKAGIEETDSNISIFENIYEYLNREMPQRIRKTGRLAELSIVEMVQNIMAGSIYICALEMLGVGSERIHIGVFRESSGQLKHDEIEIGVRTLSTIQESKENIFIELREEDLCF